MTWTDLASMAADAASRRGEEEVILFVSENEDRPRQYFTLDAYYLTEYGLGFNIRPTDHEHKCLTP